LLGTLSTQLPLVGTLRVLRLVRKIDVVKHRG
jgi:hypothetical protein